MVVPPGILADLVKLVQDLGIDVTASGAMKSLGAIWFLARIIRKYAPASWQQGAFATMISHLALEIQNKAPAAPAPVAPAKE